MIYCKPCLLFSACLTFLSVVYADGSLSPENPVTHPLSAGSGPLPTYAALYGNAVRAYYASRWYECFTRAQQAIVVHRALRDRRLQCRLLCQGAGVPPYMNADNFQPSLYLSAVNTAECNDKCLPEATPTEFNSDVPVTMGLSEIEGDFATFRPYDYLQICAYRVCLVPTYQLIMCP